MIVPSSISFIVVVVVDVDVEVILVVAVEMVVAVVVEVVVAVVVVVVGCISWSPDRHLVTMSSSLTSPPPVLTSHPLHCDRGQLTYLSCSLTRRPL